MKRYNTSDLIMIGLMAALGLGTKQIIKPLIEIILPDTIPAGAVVGGFYMLWLVLTKRFVPKMFSGTFFGLTQALVVMILPFGSHGIFTLVTYPLPGLAVDLIDLVFNKKAHTILCSLIEGAIANFVGTLTVIFFVFQFSLEITIVSTLLALLSGNLGGILAYFIAKQISKSMDLNIEIPEEKKEELDVPVEQTS
ncbi:MAG: hypothetical protein FK733_07530 [Asgard group archaeon]|nr:hypothetical protein [Asgard group archaeon]